MLKVSHLPESTSTCSIVAVKRVAEARDEDAVHGSSAVQLSEGKYERRLQSWELWIDDGWGR